MGTVKTVISLVIAIPRTLNGFSEVHLVSVSSTSLTFESALSRNSVVSCDHVYFSLLIRPHSTKESSLEACRNGSTSCNWMMTS